MAGLRRFLREVGGSAGMLFGVTVLPTLGLVGAAIDYARAGHARTALQASVDSAALASLGGNTPSPDAGRAVSIFNASRDRAGNLDGATATATALGTNRIQVSASVTVKHLMPFLGSETLVAANAVAVRGAATAGTFTVDARFLFSDAWDRNEAFLYRMNADDKTIIETKLIASNVSTSPKSVEMELGVGEAYGFLLRNTKCGKKKYSSPLCGQVTDWYSHNDPVNMRTSGIACEKPTTTHEWEDTLGTGSDRDFNDMIYEFNCVGAPPMGGGNAFVRLEK